MMKKYIGFIAIIILSLFACTQTKEDKIKTEFKKYVSSNFDDPNSLKEIVNIEQIDTVSYESIRESVVALHAIDSLAIVCDSIEKEQSTIILSKIRAHQYSSYYKNDLRNLTMRKIELSREMIAWLDDYGNSLHIMSDSLDRTLKNLEGLCVFQYRIKTRVKEDKDLKLKDYYALEDSIGFRFFDETPTFNDYSEGTAEFYKVAREYEDIIEIRKRIINEKLELNKKIQRLLD